MGYSDITRGTPDSIIESKQIRSKDGKGPKRKEIRLKNNPSEKGTPLFVSRGEYIRSRESQRLPSYERVSKFSRTGLFFVKLTRMNPVYMVSDTGPFYLMRLTRLVPGHRCDPLSGWVQ